MPKLTGNLRITTSQGAAADKLLFEVAFVPHAGRLNTHPVTVSNYDELVALLTALKFSEDDATRWAGKARTQGVILISSVERADSVLREKGLLA